MCYLLTEEGKLLPLKISPKIFKSLVSSDSSGSIWLKGSDSWKWPVASRVRLMACLKEHECQPVSTRRMSLQPFVREFTSRFHQVPGPTAQRKEALNMLKKLLQHLLRGRAQNTFPSFSPRLPICKHFSYFWSYKALLRSSKKLQ